MGFLEGIISREHGANAIRLLVLTGILTQAACNFAPPTSSRPSEPVDRKAVPKAHIAEIPHQTLVEYVPPPHIITVADLVSEVSFTETPGPDGRKVIPWTEDYKQAVAEYIDSTANYCLGIGVDPETCDEIFLYTNVVLVNDSITSHALMGRIEANIQNLKDIIHEYFHHINGVYFGVNGKYAQGGVEGIATLSAYRNLGKEIPIPRPSVLNSTTFKSTTEYYEAAAYALDQVEKVLQKNEFEKTGRVIPLDAAFANVYHPWQHLDQKNIWGYMPARELFKGLSQIYGVSESDIVKAFAKYPILGLANPIQTARSNSNIPPKGTLPNQMQQRPYDKR